MEEGMEIMQPAMQEENLGREPEELNCKEVFAKLEQLINILSEEAPTNKNQFKSLYSEIREAVEQIESCRQVPSRKLLGMFDSDFHDAWAVYSPNSMNTSQRSVFAQDYRFFVGGLRMYLSNVRRGSGDLVRS
jgi:hypothetical protein